MRPPGPDAMAMLSAVPQLLQDRLAWIMGIHRRYGDVVRLPFGFRTLYAVSHPDIIRHILVSNVKNYSKGSMFENLSTSLMGNGLATSEGAVWQRQRRWMNPHFSHDTLVGLVDAMMTSIEYQMDSWSDAALKGDKVDFSREVQVLSGSIVARTLLGASIQERDLRRMAEELKWALSHLALRAMVPFEVVHKAPLPSNRRFARAVDLFHTVLYREIREQKQRGVPSSTLISKMLEAVDPETGERMDEKEIYDQVMTLLVGGMDTSGDTLFWTLYSLAKHRHVMARVRDEVDGVLGGRAPTYEDVQKLPYLRRVIDETLRLYPPSWATARETLGPDNLGGYDVPAGTNVLLLSYVIQRRPEFWTDPETFDPDRFLPERSQGRHPLAYFPFGGGQRKCIGFQFALLELTLAISTIMQRFDLDFVDLDGVTPAPLFSLTPKAPVFVRIRKKR